MDDFLLGARTAFAAPVAKPKVTAVFDGVEVTATDAASQYEITNLRLSVASLMTVWAETEEDDLDEGEGLNDRLDALFISLCDANKDGEIDDDEAKVLTMGYELAAEYLANKGVSDEDIDALINDADDEAAERVRDLLLNLLPDGEDAVGDEIHGFAFDEDSDASVLDGATMDAVYKKRIVVRAGKKIKIRKRVSGRVRLSSKQKVAIGKAQRKAHSGGARARRARSMRKRSALGL